MNRKRIITRLHGKIASCLFFDSRMVQVNLEEDEADGILGNIYLGKVKNIVKNIDAAFVEIQQGQMCYLSLAENKDPIFSSSKKNSNIAVGDSLLVQVSREGMKTKQPTVTSNLNFTGKYMVLSHGRPGIGISTKITNKKERLRLKKILEENIRPKEGFIVRTNGQGIGEDELVREIRGLRNRYETLKEQGIHKAACTRLMTALPGYLCDIRDGYAEEIDEIVTDDSAIFLEIKRYLEDYEEENLEKLRFYEDSSFSLSKLYGIWDKVLKAVSKKVWLNSGGYLVIEPTEALTVIDVNTGKAIKGKKDTQDTFFKVNLEAAEEISWQLRLRNLSGIIVVDFIDMENKEHRELIMSRLQELFFKDPIKTTLVDMTALNLVEITRKKVRKPLHEQINREADWYE